MKNSLVLIKKFYNKIYQINFIKNIKDKIDCNEMSDTFGKAVKNLGGVIYQTMEYRTKISKEMDRIRAEKKERNKNMIISIVVSSIITLLGLLLQHYRIL